MCCCRFFQLLFCEMDGAGQDPTVDASQAGMFLRTLEDVFGRVMWTGSVMDGGWEGCCGSSVNPTTSSRLDAGHLLVTCAALFINWQNNITCKKFHVKCGLSPFSQTVRKRRLRLIGQ